MRERECVDSSLFLHRARVNRLRSTRKTAKGVRIELKDKHTEMKSKSPHMEKESNEAKSFDSRGMNAERR